MIFCVARQAGKALGCGAVVLYTEDAGTAPYAEIKRMWVQKGARGIGLGEAILAYLEAAAAYAAFARCAWRQVLTSHPARRLYEKCGYFQIPPFGDYWDDPLRAFYEKTL